MKNVIRVLRTIGRRGILILLTAAMSFGLVKMTGAYSRLTDPLMDYVPQNIGIYDTYYENFAECDCRVCHGSTEERHHGTMHALQDDCMFCHCHMSTQVGSFLSGVESEGKRDCKICHVDGGPIGDLGFPHHRSDSSVSGQCNQCHFLVARAYSVVPPLYAPDSTTPAPYSCENCHWPSGSLPHQAATYDGNTLKFLADWQNWTGYPRVSVLRHGFIDPRPIEANGPVSSGVVAAKPFLPTGGTHHELGMRESSQCYYCHASTPGSNPDWNPANPYLIRFCENCHTVGTLHSIKAHVTDDDIYRVGGEDNQLVTANEKCTACHRNFMSEPPPTPVDLPLIGSLKPNFGPPGIIVDILPALGTCFNEDPVNGLCSFGLKTAGDKVMIGQKNVASGSVTWVDASIHSWSEHLIQIKIPSGVFQPGRTGVKVCKKFGGTSPFKVFTLLHDPVVSSLTPSHSNWGQDVVLGGSNFGVKKERIYESGYGYSAYVELQSLGNKYRITKYLRHGLWDPNKVDINLTDLLDINTGNPVVEEDLYPGYWNVRVVIDYFKDNPVEGTPGKYNLGMGGLDPADELLYSVISNSICLTITRDPHIENIRPDRVLNGGNILIDGVNFGSAQGESYVLGGADSALIEIMGDEQGNEDGVCQNNEYLRNGCTLDPAKSRKISVVGWSDNEISCDLPVLSARLPLRAHVQVVVEESIKSNVKKIVIY